MTIYRDKDFMDKFGNPKQESESENKDVKKDDKDVLSVEERMMQMYEQKEKQAAEAYQKALYDSPPPPPDEEIQRRRNFWRINRRYIR